MPVSMTDRVAQLEKNCRRLLICNALLIAVTLTSFIAVRFEVTASAQAQEATKTMTVSQIDVVDESGTVRVRIGGDLPDAVIDGKTVPRGQAAAGILLYDETGQERSGYVSFSPSGNVGILLDSRRGQTAHFLADPNAGAVLRLYFREDAVELRTDEDGPSIHAVSGGRVAFHEPPVGNPVQTELCRALREAASRLDREQILKECRARTSEAACQSCLAQ